MLFMLACFSNKSKKAQLDKSTNEEIKYTIYTNNFKPLNFTSYDFVNLKKIVNQDVDRLDLIPKKIAYKLTSQDTSDAKYWCRWIDTLKPFPLGEFETQINNLVIRFYVTFSERGEVIDYLAFKRAYIEKKNKKIRWKFLSKIKFHSCTKCPYEITQYLSVKTLDTTQNVAHPSLAKIIKNDNWYIDKRGKFKIFNYSP